MKVPSRTEEVVKVRKVISGLSRLNGFPDDIVYAIEVAVGEAMANAVNHGSPNGEADTVDVAFQHRSGHSVEITIADHGAGFNLKETLEHVNPLALTEGERGLYLIAALMDEVSYTRTPEGGRLYMKKYVPGQKGTLDDGGRSGGFPYSHTGSKDYQARASAA